MTTAAEHARHSENVGAHLLGALEPEEEAAFVRHAERCPVCREEVERLRAGADALPRGVEQHAPPPTLKRALMEAVAAETGPEAPAAGRSGLGARLAALLGPGGLRPALAALAAALLLAGGMTTGYALRGDGEQATDGPAGRTFQARADRRRAPEGGGSLLVPSAGGATPVLRVRGLAPLRRGRVYQVWLQRGGEMVPGTVFAVRADGSGEVAIVDGIEEADAVLVTRERAGGARAPSELPVLSVPLRS